MGFDLATAKPVDAGGGFDLKSAKPSQPADPVTQAAEMAAKDTPEWERRAAAVGRSMTELVEGPEQIRQKIVGKLAGGLGDILAGIPKLGVKPEQQAALKKDIESKDAEFRENAQRMEPLYKESAKVSRGAGARGLGTAADVVSGFLLPGTKAETAAGRIAQSGLIGGTAAGLRPVTNDGNFAAEKAKQVAGGATGGAVVGGAVEGASRVPGLLGRVTDWSGGLFKGKEAPAVGRRGEGAERVAGELQRQREVMEGRLPSDKGNSAYEVAKTDFERRMLPVKEAALNHPAPVESAPVVRQIEQMKAASSAPARKVLDEVLKEIRHFAKQSLPQAGSRMTTAELKSMQSRGDTLTVKGADEIRQFINMKLEKTGEEALDANTKRVLEQVKNNLVGRTPEVYRNYLDQYRKGAQELDRFKPDQSATGRLSSGDRAAIPPQGMDAQKRMDKVFKGENAGRDLEALVRDTAHSPEAAKGLRSSYKDWLVNVDAVGDIKTADMLTRWRDSKDAVQKSKLFSPEHFDNVDELMGQMAKAYKGDTWAKTAGNMMGWFMGGGYKGAYLGRTIGGKMAERVEGDLERRVVDLVMEKPEVAKILVERETPDAVRRLESALAADAGTEIGQQKPKRRPNPMGLRPAGI